MPVKQKTKLTEENINEDVGRIEETMDRGKEQEEDSYLLSELIDASREVFHVPQECAVAALKPLNKSTMTVSEAKTAIEIFMNKEVK